MVNGVVVTFELGKVRWTIVNLYVNLDHRY